ncbi:MAG: rRNA maturation RNase YbeY [Culicoidibacterales bacterium]
MLTIDFGQQIDGDYTQEETFITQLLEKLVELEALTDDNLELSITLLNNEQIQVINRDYREKDQPTDVISFAFEDNEDEFPIYGLGIEIPRVLGDIFISLERAHEQAADYGHSFERELGFLAVHGCLHLLGYDHESKEDEVEMFAKQEAVLQAFDLQRAK